MNSAARRRFGGKTLAEEPSSHLVAFSHRGLAVARELADMRRVPADLAVVVKLAPAWRGGPIYGAVAFDGALVVDEELKELCSVSRTSFLRLIEKAQRQAARLVHENRGDVPFPDLHKRTAVVVDDGCSPPVMVRAAIIAVRNAGARRVVLTSPTRHLRGMQDLGEVIDQRYWECIPNTRVPLRAEQIG